MVLYEGKHDENSRSELATSIDNSFSVLTTLKQSSNPSSNTQLAVLNGTTMPAVLVECGYMNWKDTGYLYWNYESISSAISQGIMDYFCAKKC